MSQPLGLNFPQGINPYLLYQGLTICVCACECVCAPLRLTIKAACSEPTRITMTPNTPAGLQTPCCSYRNERGMVGWMQKRGGKKENTNRRWRPIWETCKQSKWLRGEVIHDDKLRNWKQRGRRGERERKQQRYATWYIKIQKQQKMKGVTWRDEGNLHQRGKK